MSHRCNAHMSHVCLACLYDKTDFAVFRQKLERINWDACFEHDNIDKVCEAWASTFLNTARENIPNKVVTVRPTDKIFYTSELRHLRHKKIKHTRMLKI